MPKQHMAPSIPGLVGALSDPAAGAGMLILTLAPFVLPALAVTALAAVALVIPTLTGAALVALILPPRRWRSSGVTGPAEPGDGQAGTSRYRSAAAPGFTSVELDVAAPACSGTAEAR